MIRAVVRSVFGIRGLGCLPEMTPPKYPHYELMGLPAAPPSSGSAAQSIQPKDQEGTESCTGAAIAQAYRETMLAQGIPCPELSSLFPYFVGRAAHGLENVDAGSTLSATAEAVIEHGMPTEETWPFSSLRVNQRPTPRCYTRGYSLRGMRGIHFIPPSDIEGLKSAIASGFALVGAGAVDRAFQSDTGPSVLDRPQSGTTIGNHAFVIDSYDSDSTFGILNSYGITWRRSGRASVTEDFVRGLMQVLVIDTRQLPIAS